jgi:hypothetical protein
MHFLQKAEREFSSDEINEKFPSPSMKEGSETL